MRKWTNVNLSGTAIIMNFITVSSNKLEAVFVCQESWFIKRNPQLNDKNPKSAPLLLQNLFKKKKGDNNYEKESISSYFRSSNDNEPCSMWII